MERSSSKKVNILQDAQIACFIGHLLQMPRDNCCEVKVLRMVSTNLTFIIDLNLYKLLHQLINIC